MTAAEIGTPPRRRTRAPRVRCHLRLSPAAHDALDALCERTGLQYRQVVERLLLATTLPPEAEATVALRAREDALMLEFSLSRAEARAAVEGGQA